jgi:hypothetical protein
VTACAPRPLPLPPPLRHQQRRTTASPLRTPLFGDCSASTEGGAGGLSFEGARVWPPPPPPPLPPPLPPPPPPPPPPSAATASTSASATSTVSESTGSVAFAACTTAAGAERVGALVTVALVQVWEKLARVLQPQSLGLGRLCRPPLRVRRPSLKCKELPRSGLSTEVQDGAFYCPNRTILGKYTHIHTYTGRTTTKQAPLVPASWVCLDLNTTVAARPRPRQRPVVALAAGAVRAVRPCCAVCVAPRSAALRVPLRLGVLRVRSRHVLQVPPHEVG